jgi:hypothetical protein
MGVVRIVIGIGKMRHKKKNFAVRFENPHHFPEQILEILNVFKHTPAMNLIDRTVWQKRQPFFDIGYDVHVGQVHFINREPAWLFLLTAPQFHDQRIIAV